jgi:hypothetical protein
MTSDGCKIHVEKRCPEINFGHNSNRERFTSTMSPYLPHLFARFVRSVAVLALPATGQVAWLGSLGVDVGDCADELALEFDDGFVMLAQFLAVELISEAVACFVLRLDDALSAMSGPANSDLWTLAALETDPRWQQVRQLAQEVLFAF